MSASEREFFSSVCGREHTVLPAQLGELLI